MERYGPLSAAQCERAVAAMTLLADVPALIVDVRRNGGGFPAMVALLTSYLVEQRTLLHTVRSRRPGPGEQSWTLPWVPGPRIPAGTPVYVLTSARTFSGGEDPRTGTDWQGVGVVPDVDVPAEQACDTALRLAGATGDLSRL